MDFCGTRILTLYMLYHAIGLGRDIEDQEIENDANHRQTSQYQIKHFFHFLFGLGFIGGGICCHSNDRLTYSIITIGIITIDFIHIRVIAPAEPSSTKHAFIPILLKFEL